MGPTEKFLGKFLRVISATTTKATKDIERRCCPIAPASGQRRSLIRAAVIRPEP
jgi:hypothetical protein